MKSIIKYFSAGICIAASVITFVQYILTPYTVLECMGLIVLMAGLFSAGCYFIVQGVKSQIKNL